MPDLPNFAAWSNQNLADFCTDSYIRMQEQQADIEELKLSLKEVSEEITDILLIIKKHFD
jgi:hypothetical protein